MLADFGCAVAYNVFSPIPDSDIFGELRALSARSLGVRVFNIHTFDKQRSALHSMTRQLIGLLDNGKIQPRIGVRLPLSHAAEAHRLLESGDVIGKIILTT